MPLISARGPDHVPRVGDPLAIRARLMPRGVIAERLLAAYPIAGPIAACEGNQVRVMGTPVHLHANSALGVGDRGAFSGFWNGTKVIPTRTLRIEGGVLAHVSGALELEAGAPRIGESVARGVQLPQGDIDDDVWTLNGVADVDGLHVQLSARGVFGGPVDLALWEGYASGPVASDTWQLFGTRVHGYDREADMPQAGTRIRACARAGRVLRDPPADSTAWAALDCG